MYPCADYFGKIIDSRMLVLRGQFFRFEYNQVAALAQQLYDFLNGQYSNFCIMSWHINDRVYNNGKGDIQELYTPAKDTFDMTGDIVGKSVYNKTTQKAYERKIRNDPIYTLGLTPPFASIDYPAYAERELPRYRNDPEILRKTLIRLFSVENSINMQLTGMHDLNFLFFSYKCEENPSTFYGSFYVEISCFGFAGEIDKIAVTFDAFARSIVERFTHVNICIHIEQTADEYSQYFGELKLPTNVTPYSDLAWHLQRNAHYLYAQQVGWSNYLSSDVSGLVRDRQGYRELSCGGLHIGVGKKITETTLQDLKEVKKSLYPALFPGRRVSNKNYPYFRSMWQNVPVLDEEIIVEGSNIIFAHQGVADLDFLLGNT